jgi:hypothetical protein
MRLMAAMSSPHPAAAEGIVEILLKITTSKIETAKNTLSAARVCPKKTYTRNVRYGISFFDERKSER